MQQKNIKNRKETILLLFIITSLVLISISYAVQITGKVTVVPEGIKIKIMLPRNRTYYTRFDERSILLLFRLNKHASWMGYSLDDSEIKELKHTVSFLSIPVGSHKLTVYVNDTTGNQASSEVFFTVEKLPEKNFWLLWRDIFKR